MNGDNDIPVCQDMDEKLAWEEDFLLQLEKEDEEEEVEDSMHSEPTLATSFNDAILVLEDVRTFLEGRGHVNTSITFIVDAVASIQVSAVKQRTLSDYFSVQQ